MGLGVVPSAWTAGGQNIEVGSAGNIIQGQASQIAVIQNATFNLGWKYSANGFASFVLQTTGQHQWFTAPSGTAGNAITFTQAMTLDASGRLSIGNTSVSAINERLNVTGNGIVIEDADGGRAMLLGHFGGADGILGTFTNDALQIRTNNTARLTIASTGAATFSGALTGTSAIFNLGATTALEINSVTGYNSAVNYLVNGTSYFTAQILGDAPNLGDYRVYSYSAGEVFKLKYATGAATFSSSVTAAGAVFTAATETRGNIRTTFTGDNSYFSLFSNDGALNLDTYGVGGTINLKILGSSKLSIASTGAATFSSSVTSTSFNGTTNNIFSVSGTEGMRLTSTGLGIGTSSPDQKLVINQGTANAFNQGVPATSGTTQNGILRLRPSISFFGETLDFGMNVGPTYAWIQATNAGGLNTNYSLVLNPNGGNLGLGVVPSAWLSSFKAFQVGTAAVSQIANRAYLTANWYYTSAGADTYIASDFATMYRQQNGEHHFLTSPSGTAGNAITFTQAMTLDANGNLGLGATSPAAKLDVVGSAGIRVNEDGAGTKVISIRSNFAGVDPAINVSTNNALLLQTNNTERMRITSGGNLLVNTTSDAGYKLDVNGTGRFAGALTGTSATFSTGINITGNGGAVNAANKFGLDQNLGAARFYSNGGDASTKGSYEFHINSSNGSLDVIALGIASTGAATFSSSVTATSLIKSGGTSAQYLMADGSTSTLTNPVTGTGTTNFLPKWTSASALGNSLVYEDATNIGINTSSPTGFGSTYTVLDVYNTNSMLIARSAAGIIGQINAANTDALYIGTRSNHKVYLTTNNTNAVTILATGDVGIGTTSPTELLTIFSASSSIISMRDNQVSNAYGAYVKGC